MLSLTGLIIFFVLMETSKVPNDHKNVRFQAKITVALNL